MHRGITTESYLDTSEKKNDDSISVASIMNDHPPQDEEARASQPTLYRLNSNQSMSSIFEEVEMAHEEVWPHDCSLNISY